MATNVNIFSHEWCELIFVHRNHNYGAFEIRENSGKRHLIAILITITSLFVAIFFIKYFDKKVDNSKTGPFIQPTIFVNIPKEVPKDKIIIPQTQAKPLKNFQTSKAFLQWVVKRDEEVREQDSIPTMDILNGFDGKIGSVDIKGTPGGTDVARIDDILPSSDNNDIIDFVEQMPQYPGGEDELLKFLGKNIKYPTVAQENGVFGIVHLQFVVFASGEIGDIKVMRGFDESCENEAIRVVKKMGRWLPGRQNGNPVNVRMYLPVKFRLE